jgi:hypothetical protein
MAMIFFSRRVSVLAAIVTPVAAPVGLDLSGKRRSVFQFPDADRIRPGQSTWHIAKKVLINSHEMA